MRIYQSFHFDNWFTFLETLPNFLNHDISGTHCGINRIYLEFICFNSHIVGRKLTEREVNQAAEILKCITADKLENFKLGNDLPQEESF